MKIYTMKLVRKETKQQRTLGNKITREFIKELVFAIPEKYLDDDGHFCINDYVHSEDRLLNVCTGFDKDGCNYDEYNYMSSLAIGETYELVFVEDLGRCGTWFVLNRNDD